MAICPAKASAFSKAANLARKCMENEGASQLFANGLRLALSSICHKSAYSETKKRRAEMVYLLATAALAFALNAEPAPKPYGPAAETRSEAARIVAAAEETSRAARQSDFAASPRDDDRNRAFACVDDGCKVATPVYNTRTPSEADARPFRSSW
jgi:hypothetical protein